mgnify:CR=1 FL=1
MNKRVRLVETCAACPEQYDAYIDGESSPSGYLRLRHGTFRVEYNGREVYRAHPDGDGIFSYEEREYYLEEAARALIGAKDKHESKSYYIDGED